MVWTAALILFAQAASGPWEQYRHPWPTEDPPQHSWRSDTGYHWIYDRDVSRFPTEVVAWVRDQYWKPNNGSTKVVSRMGFDCKGRYRFTAQSSFDATGKSVGEIDHIGSWTYIRPESAYSVYEAALCKK